MCSLKPTSFLMMELHSFLMPPRAARRIHRHVVYSLNALAEEDGHRPSYRQETWDLTPQRPPAARLTEERHNSKGNKTTIEGGNQIPTWFLNELVDIPPRSTAGDDGNEERTKPDVAAARDVGETAEEEPTPRLGMASTSPPLRRRTLEPQQHRKMRPRRSVGTVKPNPNLPNPRLVE
jgi:hypothetical protein